MRLSNLFLAPGTFSLLLCCLAARSTAYFVITEPHKGTEWSNGRANLATWRKGVLDGIGGFDVEMARLGEDGLTLVARNVPATSKSLNLMLQDVPPGDDYFLIFINSTHGVMHATSDRFTILASSASPSSNQSPPDASAATVTVSGAPDPTLAFATTFPAVPNAAFGGPIHSTIGAGQLLGMGSVTLLLMAAASWTLW